MSTVPVKTQRVLFGVTIFTDTDPLVEYETLDEAVAVAAFAGAGQVVYKIVQESDWMLYA